MAVELAAQPGPGVGPVAVGGAGLEPECLGGLLQRHAEEEPEVDQSGRAGVLGGQPGKRLRLPQTGRRPPNPRPALHRGCRAAATRRLPCPTSSLRQIRRGCGAWPRRRRRRNALRPTRAGRDCPRRAGGRPRGPAPLPGASGRAAHALTSARRASAIRHRPGAAAARRPAGLLLDRCQIRVTSSIAVTTGSDSPPTQPHTRAVAEIASWSGRSEGPCSKLTAAHPQRHPMPAVFGSTSSEMTRACRTAGLIEALGDVLQDHGPLKGP